MKKIILILLTIVFLISCTTTNFNVANRNLIYEEYIRDYIVISHVTIKIQESVLFGMLQRGDSIEDLFEKELERYSADAIINLKIVYDYDAGQGFISFITFGIYNPRTITITGDVIKYKEG